MHKNTNTNIIIWLCTTNIIICKWSRRIQKLIFERLQNVNLVMKQMAWGSLTLELVTYPVMSLNVMFKFISNKIKTKETSTKSSDLQQVLQLQCYTSRNAFGGVGATDKTPVSLWISIYSCRIFSIYLANFIFSKQIISTTCSSGHQYLKLGAFICFSAQLTMTALDLETICLVCHPFRMCYDILKLWELILPIDDFRPSSPLTGKHWMLLIMESIMDFPHAWDLFAICTICGVLFNLHATNICISTEACSKPTPPSTWWYPIHIAISIHRFFVLRCCEMSSVTFYQVDFWSDMEDNKILVLVPKALDL